MKIAKQILSFFNEDEKPAKAMNYFVTAFIFFKPEKEGGEDTVLNRRPGKQKVKATSAKDAEKVYREMVNKSFSKGGNVKKIEIVSITKGTDKTNQHTRDPEDKLHHSIKESVEDLKKDIEEYTEDIESVRVRIKKMRDERSDADGDEDQQDRILKKINSSKEHIEDLENKIVQTREKIAKLRDNENS